MDGSAAGAMGCSGQATSQGDPEPKGRRGRASRPPRTSLISGNMDAPRARPVPWSHSESNKRGGQASCRSRGTKRSRPPSRCSATSSARSCTFGGGPPARSARGRARRAGQARIIACSTIGTATKPASTPRRPNSLARARRSGRTLRRPTAPECVGHGLVEAPQSRFVVPMLRRQVICSE